MAKQNSLVKIEGTIENLTFYKSANGHFVRSKGGVSKNRIMNDPLQHHKQEIIDATRFAMARSWLFGVCSL